MATFYFNGAVDDNWNTLGNWWMDSAFTIEATALPTNMDDVIASSTIYFATATVVNLTLTSGYLGFSTITVTGVATFTNSSSGDGGTIYGNCIFNDNSYSGGLIIDGDATFNNYSNFNGFGGDVTGTITLNDFARMDSNFTGDPIFNGNSRLGLGTITGNPTFNDNSDHGDGTGGTTIGNVTFNDTSFNSGFINGNATFNNDSYNLFPGGAGGEINGNATFNDNSFNTGTITGTVTWNGLSGTNGYGTFSQGSQVLFYNGSASDNWIDLDDGMGNYNWWIDEACTLPSASIPNANNSVTLLSSSGAYGGGIIIFNLLVVNNVGHNQDLTVTGLATFNDSSYNYCNLIGNAIFNGNSEHHQLITGNATFNDNSIIIGGTITGNATFNGNSVNVGSILLDATFNDGASNDSYVYGSAIFNSGSYNYDDGVVVGLSTFNDSSYNYATYNAIGNAIFNGNSKNIGRVGGNATFNDNSTNYTPGLFNISDPTTYGVVEGTITCNTTMICPYPPKILYFNAAANGEWYDYNNWWLDSAYTMPLISAIGLPTPQDTVILNGNLELTLGGPQPEVAYVTLNAGLYTPITINNDLIVYGTVAANITAQNISVYSGEVSTGYDINGTTSIAFYYSSINYGNINPVSTSIYASFTDSAANLGTISCNANFNGGAYNGGTVNGEEAIFSGGSYNSWFSNVNGNTTFNDGAYNLGYLNSTATFNNSSYNIGVVSTEIGSVFNGLTGTVSYTDYIGNSITSEFYKGHLVLYWDGSIGGLFDWNNGGGWWLDTSRTSSPNIGTPMYFGIPAWYHAARITTECSQNYGGTPNIAALFVDSTIFNVPVVVGNDTTRIGEAIFSGSSTIGSYAAGPYFTLVYGTVTFNDTSILSNGIYYGDNIIFNDSSWIYYMNYVYPFDNGTITFNDYSYNEGNVGSTSSLNQTITFNNDSYNALTGYVNVWSTAESTTTFNDRSWNIGNVNDGAGNTLIWNGLTGMNAFGDRFTGGQYNPSQAVTFYFNAGAGNDWQALGSWWFDIGHSIPASILPTSMDDAVLSNPVFTNAGSEPTIANLLVLGSNNAYLGIPITVTGLATFDGNGSYYASMNTLSGNALFDGGINYGTISGDATFENGGTNQNGTITGSAIFDLISAEVMIFNGYDGTYGGSGSVQFKYGKGVNGSSILGLV